MKTKLTSAVIACAAVIISGCATTSDAPSAPPSATVTIQETSAAYYGSVASGKGTLNFQGQSRSFAIAGVGAGGMGAQKLNATGQVYNLNNISDFEGLYRGASSGLTLIKGKMHAKLTNDAGVVMYLAGETEGLASSIGVQEFKVAFGN